MIEAMKTRLFRHAINFYPAYFGSGGKVKHIAPDWRELHARFVLEDGEVEETLDSIRGRKSVDRVYTVELSDGKGEPHAIIEKTVYVGWRSPPGKFEGREVRNTEKEAL